MRSERVHERVPTHVTVEGWTQRFRRWILEQASGVPGWLGEAEPSGKGLSNDGSKETTVATENKHVRTDLLNMRNEGGSLAGDHVAATQPSG